MKNKYLIVSLFFALCHFSSVAQSEDFFPGEIYFKLKDSFQIRLNQYRDDSVNIVAQLPFLQPFVNTFGITSVRRTFFFAKNTGLQRIFRVYFTNNAQADGFVAELKALPQVEFAEKVPFMRTTYTPSDLKPNVSGTLAGQWQLYKINALQAWDLSRGDANVVVAIVDNAIQFTHNDLIGVSVTGQDVADNDSDPSPPTAAFSHGTHVSGIVGAQTDNGTTGIASIGFGISLMPIKTTYNTAPPNTIYKGYEGITWAADHGANIINCSWGGSGGGIVGQTVINDAWGKNAIIVAAAGNNNNTTMFYPAAYVNVISVASTDIADMRSGFSTYGTWVDVSAPGSDIYSLIPFNGFASSGGTSMASPLVAGLLGLMKSANLALTNVQLINCLLTSCDNIDLQNPAYIGRLGAGRINAYKALQCVQSIASPCPSMLTYVAPINNYNNVNGYYEASQKIIASNKVTGTSRITYDAGVFVKLTPTLDPANLLAGGFKVQTAGFFKALIEGCQRSTKTVETAHNKLSIRIFPNPTSGIFTIELPSIANTGMSFRITDLTGRLILEKQAEKGSQLQTIEAAILKEGLYFLQVLSDGKVMGVEKFVKQ